MQTLFIGQKLRWETMKPVSTVGSYSRLYKLENISSLRFKFPIYVLKSAKSKSYAVMKSL